MTVTPLKSTMVHEQTHFDPSIKTSYCLSRTHRCYSSARLHKPVVVVVAKPWALFFPLFLLALPGRFLPSPLLLFLPPPPSTLFLFISIPLFPLCSVPPSGPSPPLPPSCANCPRPFGLALFFVALAWPLSPATRLRCAASVGARPFPVVPCSRSRPPPFPPLGVGWSAGSCPPLVVLPFFPPSAFLDRFLCVCPCGRSGGCCSCAPLWGRAGWVPFFGPLWPRWFVFPPPPLSPLPPPPPPSPCPGAPALHSHSLALSSRRTLVWPACASAAFLLARFPAPPPPLPPLPVRRLFCPSLSGFCFLVFCCHLSRSHLLDVHAAWRLLAACCTLFLSISCFAWYVFASHVSFCSLYKH